MNFGLLLPVRYPRIYPAHSASHQSESDGWENDANEAITHDRGSNDEVERRGASQRQTEALYPNHRLPSLAHRRRHPNRLLDITFPPQFTSELPSERASNNAEREVRAREGPGKEFREQQVKYNALKIHRRYARDKADCDLQKASCANRRRKSRPANTPHCEG